MENYIGKIVKLPMCKNVIVLPLKYSGGGYVCLQLRNEDGEIGSDQCYVMGYAFENAVDVSDAVKTL